MGQMEFDFGVAALADYDEDGHAQIATDSPGTDGTEGTQPAESLLPAGYYARPLDPDRGPNNDIGLGSAVLTITHGDRRYVIPLGDPRDVIDGKVPKLKKGGRMISGGAGAYRSFIMIDGLDPKGVQAPGSVMIAASYANAGVKKSLGLSFNVRTAGKEDISLVHGEGARITVDSKGTTITAPGGKAYTQVSNDGNILAGKSKVQGSLTVGDQGGAQPVALAVPITDILAKLIAIVTPIVGVSGTGAPAAALAAELSTIVAKHLKTT